MAGFTSQPDEGYSEDPLTVPSASVAFALKPREDGVRSLGSARSGDEFPPWLIQHISRLSVSRKTELAMALLNDLPTTVISQIVENLYPRLYIDFVRYLPAEVCLKILGYLDPVSLINVARCCRAWYDLALDRKLWEQLYYLEGWKALPSEIAAAERDMNEPPSYAHGVMRRLESPGDRHTYKKRAISSSRTLDAGSDADLDHDTVMLDAGSTARQERAEAEAANTSIFGNPRPRPLRDTFAQQPSGLDTQSVGAGSHTKGKAVDKGKGRAGLPEAEGPPLQAGVGAPRLAKSTLWVWDGPSMRFRINWKYLYTMRRRLESNWERGRYINFQFPHPDHPEEGHGECVYSLQYNSQYLVSGSRDKTLKVWDMRTRRCLRTLALHRGSVLCLQFDSDPDEDLIVSGSSDSDVVIWRFSTGEPVQVLKHAHRESVLNVRFDKRILVTCSKDKTIKVFNRKPLRHGDLGYQEVDPVPRNIKDYGYNLPMTPDDFPVIPAWTLIGCLEGHNAAVNAVQIHDREVVSASGDRYIKVWDWPTQVCKRTIVGHGKGIACVQYDGRRIVSGSSDNEVKVFDGQTGLEVASLRSHSNLVRTLQAGFGDLPYSAEDDLAQARKVDEDYFRALESGVLDGLERSRSGRLQGNTGSTRPEDIRAYGAKLPPGGGGGKYGRIVSGSYDASIIIWRRDKEGLWKDQHHFKQETAAVNALQQHRTQPLLPGPRTVTPLADPSAGPAGSIGLPPAWHHTGTPGPDGPSALETSGTSRSQSASAPPSSATGPTLPPSNATAVDPGQSGASSATYQRLVQVMDSAVQGGPQALAQAIAVQPSILSYRGYVEAAIDRQQSPLARSQLRQTFSSALIRAQFDQGRQRREVRALRNQGMLRPGITSLPGHDSLEGASASQLTPAQLAAAAAHQAHAHIPHGASMHQVLSPVPAATTAPLATPAPPHPPPPPPPPVAAATAAAAAGSASGVAPGSSSSSAAASLPGIAAVSASAVPNAMPPQAQAHSQQHHPHIAQTPVPFEVHDPANPARVFKLQYDARRIICCSQRSVIVGWDFCNGDPELEETSRFFGHVE